MIVDMGRALHDAQEHRDSVLRKSGTSEFGKLLEVEVCLSLRAYLKGCAARASFVVWNRDAVNIGFEDAGILTKDFGNFCGSTSPQSVQFS